MTRGLPTKVVGSCMGLSGFAIAIIAGLGAGNPAETTLTRAIIAMVALYALGQVIGALAERAIDQRVREYVRANPVGGRAPGSAKRAEDEEPAFEV